jgi:hypothetical protein
VVIGNRLGAVTHTATDVQGSIRRGADPTVAGEDGVNEPVEAG